MDEGALEELVDQAVARVSELCTTDKMDKAQAIDFLEDVISRLEDAVETIREDS